MKKINEFGNFVALIIFIIARSPQSAYFINAHLDTHNWDLSGKWMKFEN